MYLIKSVKKLLVIVSILFWGFSYYIYSSHRHHPIMKDYVALRVRFAYIISHYRRWLSRSRPCPSLFSEHLIPLSDRPLVPAALPLPSRYQLSEDMCYSFRVNICSLFFHPAGKVDLNLVRGWGSDLQLKKNRLGFLLYHS